MFKQKSTFFFAVIFITRNTAFGMGSKDSKLLKKNERLKSHHLNAKTRCFKTQKLSSGVEIERKNEPTFLGEAICR